MVGLLRLEEYGVLSREVLFIILVNSIFGFAIGFGAPSVAPLIVFERLDDFRQKHTRIPTDTSNPNPSITRPTD